MRTRGILAVLALAAAGVSLFGAGAQQPTFRATTEVIVVDVSVVGKDGEPVRGLQESDFSISVSGKPRRVRTLQFVDQASGAAPAGESPLRPVSSNAPEARGRLVLILVDEGSIGFGVLPAAAQSIERLLAGLGPADKVGLASLPGPRMHVDFTRDRAKIVQAIQRVPSGAGADVRLQRVSVAVAEALRSNGAIPT